MLAWPAVREDRIAASLLFGMSGSVATLIAAMKPHQLDYVGTRYCLEARPRWASSGYFWRRLLSTANVRNESALREVQLYGLQLLGAELMRKREQETRVVRTINGDDVSAAQTQMRS
jgi:hypothetical protein